ncbi:uncharacterized protein LOC129609527 isoform X2 [Condylostylus longicornis]|uniref:uncharacterized protein LOC129609527 isoform X2 n=1 Tax=Condylostylus longicornis TaxID=2530218 RepID=UPI00244E356C|nr:uncharacterized protein LOC129609527 isoform X2 [Condylostylus longicornis]
MYMYIGYINNIKLYKMEKVLWIVFAFISYLKYSKSYEHGDGYKPEGETLLVLVNGSAQIKCDVSSNLPNDQVLLVVWYKNNLPIYSYDTRGTHAMSPSHWRDEEVLENRATFRTVKEPAELIIDGVREKDAGNFRCRVDFKLSQTRNSNVNLQVVVPPQIPQIINDRGEYIKSRAGPYEEGGDLQLICIVIGGNPPPSVTWSMNGHVLPSTIDFSNPQAINSKLIVRNLSRIHQHAVFKCEASNFPKKTMAANVTIELYLRPLQVEISFNNQPMSADRKYEIECQAIGSRPPAKITWWMDNTELLATQKVSEDGNISISTLTLTPTRQDNEKELKCRATNELVKHGIRENIMKLNVFFIPTLQLDLGSNLNPEDIEEGDDVYFECKVHANPAAYKVVWKHNNQLIQHNQKLGVIVSSGDLALQGVTRHQAGNYTCTASNVEGDGDSNIVELKVMYKPICRPDQKRVYGVARNEAAEILCEVDAYPPPESFKWSFNNTAETFDMPQSGFRAHSAQGSTLTYTPVKEMDFGTIMCWADNVVGQQKEPCVFHLIAAGKPDQPLNCTVANQTSDSLEVYCNEGFDGGLRQWFLMEIFDQQTGILQANFSSKYPILGVNGLDSGKFFKIFIYSVNMRGRSDPVQLEGYTLKAAEKQTALTSFKGSKDEFQLTPILSIGIFVGILVAIICIGIGTIAALKLRTHKHQQKYQNQNQKFSRPANLQIKDKISLPISHSEEMYDEKNPDVVPYNEIDAEYKLKSANQTPSGHLSQTSEPEVSTNIADERVTYQANKQSSDELHYAELSITNDGTCVGVGNIKIQQPNCNTVGGSGGGGSSGSGNVINTSTLTRKPPSYDYFEEPTIYAQIDHYKTSATNTGSQIASAVCSSSSSTQFPPCISPVNPSNNSCTSGLSIGTIGVNVGSSGNILIPSHQIATGNSGNTNLYAIIPPNNITGSASGFHHTLPHVNHHGSNLTSSNLHHTLISHNKSSQQQQQLQLQPQQQPQPPQYHHSHYTTTQPPPPPPIGMVASTSGSNFNQIKTLPTAVGGAGSISSISTLAPTTVLNTNNNNNNNINNNNNNNNATNSVSTPGSGNGQYSREIVTVRTPLMYAQQESCV